MRYRDVQRLGHMAADMADLSGRMGHAWLNTYDQCMDCLVLKFGSESDQEAVYSAWGMSK